MKTHNFPRDQYGHIQLENATTDPYGHLEWAVGSGDDFHCFDYAIFQHEGESFCVLHSVINSETGSFIMDGRYEVVNLYQDNWEGEVLQIASDMVGEALDWLCEGGGKPIHHTIKGWNQDPYYFVRAVARGIWRHGIESEEIASMSRQQRWFRFGSIRLNRAIKRLCPTVNLPVSYRPFKQSLCF